jgi:hypothetical protein
MNSCSERVGMFSLADSSTKEKSIFKIFKTERELPSDLSPVAFKTWYENDENGMKQKREMGDFEFTTFYQTNDYLALKEMDKEMQPEKTKFENKCREYGNMTYVSFRIENTNAQSELLRVGLRSDNEYYARLEYFSFKMQNDFKLVNGKDTLDCLLYNYERTYSLTPFATFVLGFPKIDKVRGFKLIYHDKIFNNGIIVTNFDKDIINNIPKITI